MDTEVPVPLTDAAAWKSAMAQFNEQFGPIEKEVVVCLKERLIPVKDDPIKVINY